MDRSLSMRLLLTRLKNIVLTTITIPLTLSSLFLLLVRLGGYIVNLCYFYSYRFIGKPTSFLQLQVIVDLLVLIIKPFDNQTES
jgi:hypothetical protein